MPVDTRPWGLYPTPGGDPCKPRFGCLPEDLEESIRLPPDCPLKFAFESACSDCQAGTFSKKEQQRPQTCYRYRLSVDEATEITSALVVTIADHRDHISQVLSKHADDLMARWGRKGRFGSQQKRQDLLKTAAPDLPESLDFIPAWGYDQYLERYETLSRPLKFQHKLMLPWLTVDLLKNHPDALFALLHYRTTHEPAEWAAFDRLQLEKNFQRGELNADWSEKAMVMFGADYGLLADWDASRIHRGDLLGFPLGLLILRAQAYLMEVLRNIVDAIMVEVQSSAPSRTEKWQRLTLAQGFKPTGSVEPWSSYTHGFLFPAPETDALDYLTLARSRRERAEDQLAALQCSIPYMRRQIQAMPGTATSVAVQVGSQMFNLVRDHVLWKSLESEVQHFSDIRSRFRDSIRQGHPLPHEYDRALGDLEVLLINHIIQRSRAVTYQLPLTPGFSKHYSEGKTTWTPLVRNNTFEVFNSDRLYWIVTQLCNHPEETDAFDFPFLIALLHEHLAESPKKEKERLHELMYEQITDIAACHELLIAVGRLHRPQSTNPDSVESMKSGRLAWRQFQGDINFRVSPDQRAYQQVETSIANAGPKLFKAFAFHQPPQGPRGKPWIAYNRALHTSLREFSASMKIALKAYLSLTTLSPDEEAGYYEALSCATRTEHVEAVAAEEKAILAEIDKWQKKLATPVPVFTDMQPTGPVQDANTTTVRKDKKKTRRKGKSQPPGGAEEDRASESLQSTDPAAPNPSLAPDGQQLHGPEKGEQQQQQQPTIPVSRRNMDEVFGALFPAGNRADAKRAVDWNTFSRAMQAVGCTLDNGSGGSEVLFRHAVFGKITFHKPHPEPKIDPIKLHAWGDRLARRFGWRRERFVVLAANADGAEGDGER